MEYAELLAPQQQLLIAYRPAASGLAIRALQSTVLEMAFDVHLHSQQAR